MASNPSFENEINHLFVYEQNQSFSFSKSMYKGEKEILIVVKDTQNKNRAKFWARKLHKIYHVHVLAVTLFHSQKIDSYINKNNIASVIVVDIEATNKGIVISTEDDSLYSFLSESLSINNEQQVNLRKEDVKTFRTCRFTSLIKIGQIKNYHRFFAFFTSYIHLHPKLSLEHRESKIYRVSGKKVGQNIPFNRVELNPSVLEQLNLQENDYVVIYNPMNSKFAIGCIKSSKKSMADEIILSLSIKKKLELPSAIVFHPLKKIISSKIQIQAVKKIADGSITVSDDIFQKVNEIGTSHFEIVNGATSASIDLERSKIILDSSLDAGTIRLSYLQREFLNFEHPPDTLSDYYYQLFSSTPELTDEQLNFLAEHYSHNKVHKIDTYEEKVKAKKLLQKVGYNRAVIYPLPEKRRRKKLNPLQKLFHFYLRWSIRPSSVKLKVIRPYSTDESSNIVRVSKSVMSLLGIAENDLITLHYRGRTITVPVLELASTELIKETNIISNESSINISIGIPAHLRDKLGIKQIGKICDVERDLFYLFRKSVNTQFLPVLATIFTITQLKIDDWWIKVAMIIIIVPLSSYLTLSAVREKIPKL